MAPASAGGRFAAHRGMPTTTEGLRLLARSADTSQAAVSGPGLGPLPPGLGPGPLARPSKHPFGLRGSR
jgi:hypothetical protein